MFIDRSVQNRPEDREWVTLSVWIEEAHFLSVGDLELLKPPFEVRSSYRRIFHLTGTHTPPEFFKTDLEIPKFYGSPELPSYDTEGVSLDLGPGSPLDDDSDALEQQLLRDLPLQLLDLRSDLGVPEVDSKGIHPVIRAHSNGGVIGAELLGQGRLAAARQSADDYQSTRFLRSHPPWPDDAILMVSDLAPPCDRPVPEASDMSHRSIARRGSSLRLERPFNGQ